MTDVSIVPGEKDIKSLGSNVVHIIAMLLFKEIDACTS